MLVRTLADEPFSGAGLLARYGDRGAIPALRLALDRASASSEDPDPQLVARLADAVRALGGELPERLESAEGSAWRVAGRQALEFRRSHIRGFGFDAITPRPAAADPCPCGGGRGYGACCAAEEQRLADEAEVSWRAMRHWVTG